MHHLLGNITTSLEAMDLKVSTREMTSPKPFFLQQIPCSVYMRELLAGTFTILCHRDRTLEWDLCGGGIGSGRLGEGGGRCMGGGNRGAGSRIPKVVESIGNRGKLCNIVQYFAIKIGQRSRSQQIWGEPGLKGLL